MLVAEKPWLLKADGQSTEEGMSISLVRSCLLRASGVIEYCRVGVTGWISCNPFLPIPGTARCAGNIAGIHEDVSIQGGFAAYCCWRSRCLAGVTLWKIFRHYLVSSRYAGTLA